MEGSSVAGVRRGPCVLPNLVDESNSVTMTASLAQALPSDVRVSRRRGRASAEFRKL